MKAPKMLSLILIFAVGFNMVGGIQAEARGSRHKKSDYRGKWSTSCKREMMADHMLKKLADELTLTTEQKQEIAAIVAKYQVASQDRKEALRKARSALMEKILTEELDETSIRAEYQKIAAESKKLREERFVEIAKILSEIKAVLTEEQLKVLQEKGTDWFQHKKSTKHGGYKKDKSRYKKDKSGYKKNKQ